VVRLICIVALVVFSFLGIFSAKYRAFAREAFNCVFRRVTLRKCNTDFDKRLKAKISAKLFKKNRRVGKFVFGHFEAISWVFTALLIVSLIISTLTIYNLVVFGSCDPHSTSCVFKPGVLTCGSPGCLERGCDCEAVGCEAPAFVACEGNCDCQENLCG
jgi:hypothetical protein